MNDFKPKHTIFDKEKFAEERTKLGGLAQERKKTTREFHYSRIFKMK